MLYIKEAIVSAMLAHVTAAWPLEACGFLGGHPSLISHFYPVPNLMQSRTAYRMEPAAQLRALLDMEAAGCTEMVIYHSHPDGPERPSPTDVAQITYPEAVYLIISLQNQAKPIIRAFRIMNDIVRELPWKSV